MIDLDDFNIKLETYSSRLCGVMITNPNTSGVFEEEFHQIAKKVHLLGGLVYMDGANMNAIAGKVDLGNLALMLFITICTKLGLFLMEAEVLATQLLLFPKS